MSFMLSRVEWEHQLKRVRDEIGSITRDMMDDQLCDIPAAISSPRVADTAKNDVVIGIDEDLIAIKGRLCGESSKLEVIPIVGMGGIGKTTLARYAYDDPLIMEYFHIHAFIQVSQDYSAKEFLLNLLASIKTIEEKKSGEKDGSEVAGNESEILVSQDYSAKEFLLNLLASIKTFKEKKSGEKDGSEVAGNESEILERAYKSLKGRRYLIVMDDIWSTDAWDDVRNIFPDDNNGSRIMLTTRLSDVAAYASSGSPCHDMNFMDGNQSWNLLRQKVFANGPDCPHELEAIGKKIARCCGGLPLAVVLLGGILSTVVKTQASWEEITKNANSVVDGQLEGILSLSYTHLPHHLRPCFLFMGAFPEDHNIHVSRLIRLWVAEGFLKHQNGHKTLEEEAEDYLQDLVKRSLVLITSRKSDGKIKSCSLHDLVREMCITKAQEEKFLVMDGRDLPERAKDWRRISIVNSHLNEAWCPRIHTVLCFQTIRASSSLASLVKFRLLRVLDIMNAKLSWIDSQIFELFLLRYLALGCSCEFPAAISKLENLQTLIIRPWKISGFYESVATYLPLEIWRMPHLRNLVLTENYMLPDPLSPTRPLENLHTLSGIASFVCSKRILKMIPNLKKLGIIYYRDEEHQYLLHNLVNLHWLEKLKISTSWELSSWQVQYPAFPLALKKLTLVGGRLPWKYMSIVGLLPNLQVLKLKDNACAGYTWETTNDGFPQLKFLLIVGSNLHHWITESNHFPRLKCLALLDCPCLRRIPDCIGDIPTLEFIEVDSRNKYLVKSAKQIQEDQLNEYSNDAFQVCFKEKDHIKWHATPLKRGGGYALHPQKTGRRYATTPVPERGSICHQICNIL